MYYDEYSVYNSDSAMIYVDQNLDIADKLNKKEWKAEWKIKKSFLLAATGLLKEALDELRNVSSQLLTPELKVEYYGQLMYLYSHFRQYSGDNNTNIREGYYEKRKKRIKTLSMPTSLLKTLSIYGTKGGNFWEPLKRSP